MAVSGGLWLVTLLTDVLTAWLDDELVCGRLVT